MDSVAAQQRDNVEGQMDFFSMAAASSGAPAPVKEIPLPDIPEYTPEELMTMEKATTGLYLSGHPMDHYREIVRKLNAPSISSILADFAREDGPERFTDGQRVTIAGVITSSKTKTTKNNSLMAYVMVEDDTASMELLCFSRVLETCGAYMKENLAVVVKGRLSVRDEKAPQIVCDSIYPLTTADGGIPEPQPKQEASGGDAVPEIPQHRRSCYSAYEAGIPDVSWEKYRQNGYGGHPKGLCRSGAPASGAGGGGKRNSGQRERGGKIGTALRHCRRAVFIGSDRRQYRKAATGWPLSGTGDGADARISAAARQ